MQVAFRGVKQVIIVDNKYINPTLYHWVLIDWGGNIEQAEVMTAYEAKLANEKLQRETTRLIRWAPKDGTIKNIYLETPPPIKT